MLFVSERVTIRRVAGPATAANGKTLKSAIVVQNERIISFSSRSLILPRSLSPCLRFFGLPLLLLNYLLGEDPIRSNDLRNSPPLCGLARSRLQKTLLIHHN